MPRMRFSALLQLRGIEQPWSIVAFLWAGQVLSLGAAIPPERLHYPQQTSGYANGWSVSPEKGQLGIVMPVGTVPGDIPIPVVYRFNATYAQQYQTYLTLNENVKTGMEAWAIANGLSDLPIAGTMHFGMIQPQPGWYPPDAGLYQANPTWNQEASYWVLEDGTQFTNGDFGAAISLSSSLYNAFGLAPLGTPVNVDSTGQVAFYSATAANLGNWQSVVANLTTSTVFQGNAVVGPVGYQVVMDRNKARIFAFDYKANCWVPVLWVDRFNHSVTFNWQISSTQPSGYSAVSSVTALNNQGHGLQAQWVKSTSQAALPLLRVDFIGVQAPSLQVTGYSGYAAYQPAALGSAGTYTVNNTDMMALRPTEVRVGNPAGDLSVPSWLSAGLPLPSSAAFTEPWPADRVWTFGYDSVQAELQTMTDPLSVATQFTWTSTNLYSFTYLATNGYRSEASAVSTDARTGVVLTRNYQWSLPATSAGPWTTSRTQAYSGTLVVPAPALATNLITTYTFAPAGDPNFNNAAMTNVNLASGSTQLVNTAFMVPSTSQAMLGYDGTLSFAAGQQSAASGVAGYSTGIPTIQTTTYPMGDSPTLMCTSAISPTTGLLNSLTRTSASFQDVTTYTYDPNAAGLLDPARMLQTSTQRTCFGTTVSAPVQVTSYDPISSLPNESYLLDPASGSAIGQNPIAYDAYGHPSIVTSFATGPLFSSTSNTTTQTWTVDSASGLPTAVSVAFADQTKTSGQDGYCLQWPLGNYDTAGRPEVATDGLGVTTAYGYDALGRVILVKRGGQAEIDRSYPSEWQAQSVQNGRTTSTTLDGFGHLLKRVRGTDGVTETYAIDTNGQSVTLVETPPSGAPRTTQKTFDGRGRLVSLAPPIGPATTYAYALATGTFAGCQAVNATYSGQTFTTARVLDQWGQLLSATDPMGTVTNTTYDGMGHATTIKVTPAGGLSQTRTFNYNALGFLVSKSEPETGTQTFSHFESHGRPTTIIENSGRTRTLVYDGLGRVRQVTGGIDSQTFNYNGLENGTFATTSAGQTTSVTYGYTDGFGRINVETVTPPANAGWTQTYGYDFAGRLGSITYPDANVVTYAAASS